MHVSQNNFAIFDITGNQIYILSLINTSALSLSNTILSFTLYFQFENLKWLVECISDGKTVSLKLGVSIFHHFHRLYSILINLKVLKIGRFVLY